MDKLPADLTAEPLAQRTRVLGQRRHGLATWYDQNRVNVRLDQVSEVMQQGDPRHRGLPLLRARRPRPHRAPCARSSPTRPTSGVVQGGSSITQQMVKMTLAAPGHRGAAQGRHRGQLPPQVQRAALRDRVRAEVLQGLDPASATSTSPTSATAPTASRRRPGTTSPSPPASSSCARRRCSPGW